MGLKDLVQPVTSALLGSKVGEYAGAVFNSSKPGKQRKKEYERQKEFAQNALSWRVADAERAGLHPLAALGMPVSSYAPQSVGGEVPGQFADMGADITRAATALADPISKLGAQAEALSLENMGLQNDLLRSQIAKMNQPGSPAGIVDPFGQGGVAGVSNPGKNAALQPHYGEGADFLTAPDLVYDLLRRPGAMLDPALSKQASALTQDALRMWDRYDAWARSLVSNSGGGGW